ncbi:MAG: ABC transporter permease subunit [Candidatus Poribacteria bacterium]|nr:ABC transporter permease subunit [Candidatus Poribacteria bacterium]
MLQNSTNTPFWRDVRFLKVLLQVLFLLGVAAMAGFFYSNMMSGLSDQGHPLSLSFLRNEAGFEITEGIDFDPSDTYLKAFWVGVVNTLRVSILGIICATVLGFIFGVARLSTNWLIRSIAAVYVEIFRNVPLLLQILFWYAITLSLPRIQDSITIADTIILNVRGIYLPTIAGNEGLPVWLWYLLSGVGLAIIVVLCYAGLRLLIDSTEVQQTDRPSFASNTILGAKWFAAPVFLIVAIAGWFLSPGQPLQIVRPELQGFNYVGGINFTPEFLALLVGLTVYTSAYIAEVVRSGIQAVVKGQREAARAVGLTETQVLLLVVIPQAIPIIVPPLTSQYLNLAKNSSLAIAIGFLDLFHVGRRMIAQTGQTIPIFGMIMVSYLIMSLTTSAFMNWYNRRITRFER